MPRRRSEENRREEVPAVIEYGTALVSLVALVIGLLVLFVPSRATEVDKAVGSTFIATAVVTFTFFVLVDRWKRIELQDLIGTALTLPTATEALSNAFARQWAEIDLQGAVADALSTPRAVEGLSSVVASQLYGASLGI